MPVPFNEIPITYEIEKKKRVRLNNTVNCKKYRETHKDTYGDYMKEYMREYMRERRLLAKAQN